MTHELEPRIAEQMGDVVACAGIEIVYAKDFVALTQEPLANVGAKKSSSSRHKHALRSPRAHS